MARETKRPESPLAPSSGTERGDHDCDRDNDGNKTKLKKRKRHRKKSEKGASSAATCEGEARLPDHLPDHILVPTFQRVMKQGLCLAMFSSGRAKRVEQVFWIEGSCLRWGKQKGKERGCLELGELSLVEDIGGLEVRLSAHSGQTLEVGASSAVEKILLLRAFTLRMAQAEF